MLAKEGRIVLKMVFQKTYSGDELMWCCKKFQKLVQCVVYKQDWIL